MSWVWYTKSRALEFLLVRNVRSITIIAANVLIRLPGYRQHMILCIFDLVSLVTNILRKEGLSTGSLHRDILDDLSWVVDSTLT